MSIANKNKLKDFIEQNGIDIEENPDMLDELGEPEAVYEVEG